MEPYIHGLIGGALIGLASSLMLIFNGRVTGISGIYNRMLFAQEKDRLWRIAFIGGLILGGIVIKIIRPEFFINTTGDSPLRLITAGFLVGVGTVMGGGCTSGHGICGLSRLSLRSLWATIVFMTFGFATATLLHFIRGS